MTSIKNTCIVNHSAQQLYDLVNDIESYSDFLPWCKAARIEKSEEGSMTATLDISKGPVNTSFTTHNLLSPPHKIVLNLVDGPFKSLQGVWEFTPIEADKSCSVAFELEFSFNTLPMQLILKPFMKNLAEKMLNLFVKRANKIYAKN